MKLFLMLLISSSPRTLNFDRFSNFMASFKINGELVAICTESIYGNEYDLDGDTYAIGGKGFRAALNEGILNLSGSMTAFSPMIRLSNMRKKALLSVRKFFLKQGILAFLSCIRK